MYIYLDSSGTYVCTPLSGKYTVSLTEMSATSSKKVKKVNYVIVNSIMSL